LALCRWGLAAVLSLADELSIIDPRAVVWRDRLQHLANYSVGANGLNVAKDLPFDQPHRHFSHLMGAVLKDPLLSGSDEALDLVVKSVDQWRSLRDPCTMNPRPASNDAGWTGFSFAASALLNARLGRPAQAVADLTWFVDHSAVDGKVGHRGCNNISQTAPCPPATIMNGSVFHPNTFYSEGVGDPTGETPFGLAAAVQEFLVGTAAADTAGETITVFPGFGTGTVATSIRSACFHRLRVSGAFLLSGCFGNATTTFVRVESNAGRSCRLQLPSLQQPLAVLPSTIPMKVLAGGVIELLLAVGQSATVYAKGASPDFSVKAMPVLVGEVNFWGSKPQRVQRPSADRAILGTPMFSTVFQSHMVLQREVPLKVRFLLLVLHRTAPHRTRTHTHINTIVASPSPPHHCVYLYFRCGGLAPRPIVH
jgi:hypothetical protein